MSQLITPFQVTSVSAFLTKGILFFSCIMVCMSVVFVKHQSRNFHMKLQLLKETQFSLETEWSQLILEKWTWCSDAYVETVATQQLGMFTPDPKALRILK
jgi:cell division protein FtsL